MAANAYEDIQFYEDNKHLLSAVPARHHASLASCAYRGLVNQGSTCYLNSLLQVLFHDASFLHAVVVVHAPKSNVAVGHPDSVGHPKGEDEVSSSSIIIRELRRLFLRMLYSNKSALDTEQLLLSFGWTKSQFFEQHDVHEFFSVLLDILSDESRHMSDSINNIFVGKVNDVLLCASCSFTSARCDPFNSISIDIPFDAPTDQSQPSAVYQLQNLIANHLQHEVLDDDNKWRCQQCNQCVAAHKYVQYESLPPILVIHLKRFRFDPLTRKRKKLHARVVFPPTLSSEQLMTRRQHSDSTEQLIDYELVGVVVHSGTAMGGHYYAYVRPCLDVGEQQASSTDSLQEWMSFNDSNVQIASPLEAQALFRSDDIRTGADDADVMDTRGSFIRDNAYLLVYRAKHHHASAIADKKFIYESLSDDDKADIEAENATHSNLCRLRDIESRIVEVVVIMDNGDGDVAVPKPCMESPLLTITTLRTSVIRDVLEQSYALSTARLLFSSADFPIANCRLRRCEYNKVTRCITRRAETFGESMDLALGDLASKPPISFVMERRLHDDPPFAEHYSDDMYVELSVWPPSLPLVPTEVIPGSDEQVPVDGRVLATVRDLRMAASRRLSLHFDRFNLIVDDGHSPVRLLDASLDDSLLMKTQCIHPGSRIVVEVLSTDMLASTGNESAAIQALLKQKSSILLYFNNPFDVVKHGDGTTSEGCVPREAVAGNDSDTINPSSIFNNPSYNLSIEALLDQPLHEVMSLIASVLRVGDDRLFHCKRSATTPQLKDTDKTLRELAFVNHSIVHVQEGLGCRPGEHMLRFELLTDSMMTATTSKSDHDSNPTAPRDDAADTAESRSITPSTCSDEVAASKANIAAKQSTIHLFDLPISEKMTVNQVKHVLFDRLKSSQLMVQQCKSPLCIRLRDGKSAKLSTPLRDDRLLNRCLLGLSDGRRVVVQVLEAEEHIGADDIIISMRFVAFMKRIVYPSIDVPISRSSSIPILFKHIMLTLQQLKIVNDNVGDGCARVDEEIPGVSADLYTSIPELKHISIAKGYSTGPPLTLKASLKLKWDDPAVFDAAICRKGLEDDQAVVSTVVSSKLVTVDQLPLNLRDGSVIAVRGRADYESYARNSSATTDGSGLAPKETSAGNGLRAVRFKKELRTGTARSITVLSKPSTAGSLDSLKINNSVKERSLKIVSTSRKVEGRVNDDGLPDSDSSDAANRQQ